MDEVQKIKKHTFVKLAFVYGAGIAFVACTNPMQLPVPLLVVPFLWLFVALFMTVNGVLLAKVAKLTRKRRVVIAGVCATLPVLLLVFQSIHQLSLKDFLIALALVVSVSFYMLRADFLE